MGYTTDFEGTFNLDKPLSVSHYNYLTKFSETRRMKRNSEKAESLPDSARKSAGLPIGKEGEFFVGDDFTGQNNDVSIVDHNYPPSTQPGLWCQWIPTEDGTGIEWDGGEKFYKYETWLKYLIENFLERWGYVLNGEVRWQGEDSPDKGILTVTNNIVKVTNL